MPLCYSIDPAQRIVSITGEYADASEWRALGQRMLLDPQWQPGFAFLRDLRDATTPVDAATVAGIMEVVKQFWPLMRPTRAAIVTPREFDPAAMTAHALADAEDLPIRMFLVYENAVAWLREGQ